MTKLLFKLFIKRPESTKDPQVREAYGILAGCVGIVVNLVLCAAKFMMGLFTGSIAIKADAVNNLSDVGSSTVTLIGFKAAGKPADREHPFGHARMEYISALIIAFLILLVGVELGRGAIEKILNPTPVNFSVSAMVVLAVSIFAKLWLGLFNRSVAKRIDSGAMEAAFMDSLCDMISTGAILVSTVIGYFTRLNLDGYIGVLVACFVLYAGVKIVKDAISPLMGEAPSVETVQELTQQILAYEGINGIHDMVIHNYGPGRRIATLHAEVDARADILETHEIIDHIEKEVGERMNMLITIHLDPIQTDDELANTAREHIADIIAETDGRLRFHDFRVVRSIRLNLFFDLVVPPEMSREDINAIQARICQAAESRDHRYLCVITIDRDFLGC